MSNRKILSLLTPLVCWVHLGAQSGSDSSRHTLSLLAATDVYYAAFNTDLPASGLAPYNTVGPRDNTFGLNVAQIGLSYTGPNTRANFTYQIGDIPLAAWSPEFPNVQAANAGFRVASDWWVDAGFFSTHIGYESFLPRQKYLSSTAFISFNEPFFQAGLRAAGPLTERLSAQVWLLNGYNTFVETNAAKSVGVRLSYQISETANITYNNLLGGEGPDDGASQFRQTHNLFASNTFADRLTVILNATYVYQTNTGNPASDGASVGGGFLTIDYALTDRFNATVRGEYFTDEAGFISGRVPAVQFNVDDGLTGVDLIALATSLQYRPAANAYVRAETRLTRQGADMRLFTRDGARLDDRVEFLLTAGVSFGREVRW